MIKCKYCKNFLNVKHEQEQEYHDSCQEEFEKMKQDKSSYTQRMLYLEKLKENLNTYCKDTKNDHNKGAYYDLCYNDPDRKLKEIEYYDMFGHALPPHILLRAGLVTKLDEVSYYEGKSDIIIYYETDSLELPDLFSELPSLRKIIITVRVNETFNYECTIPPDLLQKCIIFYKFVLPLHSLKEHMSKIVKLHIDGLYFGTYDIPSSVTYDKNDPLYTEIMKYHQNQIEEDEEDELFREEQINYLMEELRSDKYLIDKFPNISSLIFQGTIHPSKLVSFKNLKHLKLWHSFDNIIFTFKQLHLLSVKVKTMTLLPSNDPFKGFNNLEFLSLENFDLSEFPASIRYLKNLKILILNNCRINDVPDWLVELQELKILSLYRNNINEFPFSQIKGLPNLKYLNLLSNHINKNIDLSIFTNITMEIFSSIPLKGLLY